MFIYLNVDPFERMYAHADGFPRWSLWQLPFTAPEGAAGALLGMLVVFVVGLARRRTPTV
jgi:MYXO-CTERM domain-containing protein